MDCRLGDNCSLGITWGKGWQYFLFILWKFHIYVHIFIYTVSSYLFPTPPQTLPKLLPHLPPNFFFSILIYLLAQSPISAALLFHHGLEHDLAFRGQSLSFSWMAVCIKVRLFCFPHSLSLVHICKCSVSITLTYLEVQRLLIASSTVLQK